jgi:hypothetical protein
MEDEQQPQIHSRRSYIYESKGGGKNKKKLFAIVGGIVIVILVLIIGSMVFSGGEDESDEDIFATPASQAPTDAPTPTVSEDEDDANADADAEEDEEAADDADLDRSEYTILIQNGSGTAGAAGRLADILGDLGYTLAETENADNFDYTETEISVSNGNTALLELLESDIEDEYTIGDTSTDYDGDEDAVIIIGAE